MARPGDARRPAALDGAVVEGLIEAWLAPRSAATRRAYGSALRDLAAFCETDSVVRAVTSLLQGPPALADALARRYRRALIDQGLLPASINVRLSALRSLSHEARRRGLVPWTVEVAHVPAPPRDAAERPDADAYRAMLAAVGDATVAGPRALVVRNRAILRLLYDVALRCGELVALDVADVDLDRGRLRVAGAGHTGAVWLDLPPPTRAALTAWVAARRELAGVELPPAAPLFVNSSRDPRCGGGRLSARSVGRVVAAVALAAGVHTTPVGLRHAAISAALEATHGDVRAVQRFSRHASPRAVLRRSRREPPLQRDVAALVAGD